MQRGIVIAGALAAGIAAMAPAAAEAGPVLAHRRRTRGPLAVKGKRPRARPAMRRATRPGSGRGGPGRGRTERHAPDDGIVSYRWTVGGDAIRDYTTCRPIMVGGARTFAPVAFSVARGRQDGAGNSVFDSDAGGCTFYWRLRETVLPRANVPVTVQVLEQHPGDPAPHACVGVTATRLYTVSARRTARAPAGGLLRRDQPLAPGSYTHPYWHFLFTPDQPVPRTRLPRVPPRVPAQLRRVARRVRLPDRRASTLPIPGGTRFPRHDGFTLAHTLRDYESSDSARPSWTRSATRRRPLPSARFASRTTRQRRLPPSSRTSGPTSTTSAASSSSRGTAVRMSTSAATWGAQHRSARPDLLALARVRRPRVPGLPRHERRRGLGERGRRARRAAGGALWRCARLKAAASASGCYRPGAARGARRDRRHAGPRCHRGRWRERPDRRALGGDDVVCGGPGRDRLSGGPGDEEIMGDAGADRIGGNAGSDTIEAGAGNDRVSAGSGPDHPSGGSGNDVVEGGTGSEWMIIGGRGNDRLDGGPGRDHLHGGPGSDRLAGGPGMDGLLGEGGNDRLDGRRRPRPGALSPPTAASTST